MARRGALLALVVVAILATSGCAWTSGSAVGPATPTSSPTGAPGARAWLSGASGFGVASGDFGRWRGTPVEVVSTWADTNDAMTGLSQLRPGGEYGEWDGPMDIAIGAIGVGESWGQAAVGAYDGRWRESLTNLRELRGGRSGTTFIRFAHEMNGNWYPWAVNAGNYRAFIEAWRRFRGLQREVFPAARLVFGVNRESVGAGMDWRLMFPGTEYVDVFAVDYFNQFACVVTQRDWDIAVVARDPLGEPRGLEQHRLFAESVGLPIAVPEWGCNADQCDSPVYVQNMHDWFRTHQGTGPGQLLYESLFNVAIDGDRWGMYGGNRLPQAAQTYRDLF